MITGAIFDMDGLLFDTERIYQSIWYELAEENGVSLDDRFTSRISGTSGEEAYSLVREYYKVDDPRPIHSECARRMAERSSRHIDIMPGVIDMLEYLRLRNVRCVVASGSSTRQILNNLRVAGITDYFNAVVGGTELIYGKPLPHIFLYAAEKIQCDSHDCLVFEDSIKGILAAHAAGSHPIMIPDLMEPTPEVRAVCHEIYPDMHAALDAISRNPDYLPV